MRTRELIPFPVSAAGAAMNRREFIRLLGGAAVVLPITARAQQVSKPPTIGYIGQSTAVAEAQRLGAFVQRLRELGWTEGRNVAIEYRWAEGSTERFTSQRCCCAPM